MGGYYRKYKLYKIMNLCDDPQMFMIDLFFKRHFDGCFRFIECSFKKVYINYKEFCFMEDNGVIVVSDQLYV